MTERKPRKRSFEGDIEAYWQDIGFEILEMQENENNLTEYGKGYKGALDEVFKVLQNIISEHFEI